MILTIIKLTTKLAKVLDSLAQRETLKTQKALTEASELVAKANKHRATAATGRKVASALRDLVDADAQKKTSE
ncbi:hypothetical protein [Achromobacter sp. DH1f]|uniref:hypothetical protein n=1 Tax=Achromobacter sp. DH1f TaxID=1397275 RepID=UPI000468EE8B|nr:hypothetical protein [Achromobacter sp. DH1f]